MEVQRRATGLVISGIMFAIKAGIAIGGFMTLRLLAAFHYVPNQAQAPEAVTGIKAPVQRDPGRFLARVRRDPRPLSHQRGDAAEDRSRARQAPERAGRGTVARWVGPSSATAARATSTTGRVRARRGRRPARHRPPGRPGETHTITYGATAVRAGSWVNCAELSTAVVFGADASSAPSRRATSSS